VEGHQAEDQSPAGEPPGQLAGALQQPGGPPDHAVAEEGRLSREQKQPLADLPTQEEQALQCGLQPLQPRHPVLLQRLQKRQ